MELRKCECGTDLKPEFKSTAYEYRYIECPACKVETGGKLSVFEAIQAWNEGKVE